MTKVVVTGATGFTGRHVVPLLLERYGEVTCFVRPSSDTSRIALPGVRFAIGDLDDASSVENALCGHEVLVNVGFLTGKGDGRRNRAEGIVDACRATKIKRAVFVSSTSIFTTLPAPAKQAKLSAEQAVLNSGLDYTILRPTLIYGTDGDRNMIRLLRLLRRSPVIFIPGDGESRQQPIHVEDLARAIVNCIEVKEAIGKAYNLSGAHSVTFNEVIDESCRVLGIRRVKIHLPVTPALWLADLSKKIIGKTLLKHEQILRLNEDKVFDHGEAKRDFNFNPRSFAEGIRQEADQYCKYGPQRS